MFNKEVLLGVIQLLGIVGFIILLFFILIAKYIKKDSERKIFIYSFIAISLFLVVWITITSYPLPSITDSQKDESIKPLIESVKNNSTTQNSPTNHSLQSIENNNSEDSNNTNINTEQLPNNSSSQVIKNGNSIRSTNSNIKG